MSTKDSVIEDGGQSPATDDGEWDEAETYHRLLSLVSSSRSGRQEDLRTTPLFSLAVKNAVNEQSDCPEDGAGMPTATKIFDQFAVLGFHIGDEHPFITANEPILVNVSAPNSTFICGSQGSGKSYTLSCLLENCLVADNRIGRVSRPLAAVAFQYDPDSAGSVAETAYLCSLGIHVNVLVSQSNEYALRAAYSRVPNAEKCLTVSPLLFRPSDLSFDRMLRLMAFNDKDNAMPLYMSVALRILRQMAAEANGAGFDYERFKALLANENLTRDQLGPLRLRLDLLESFLDRSKKMPKGSSKTLADLKPGTLTIVDLTDPFMDPATVCILFDICLGLVEERRPSCGLVVALDEAHKYMTNSLAASNFTDRLLSTIRMQRHLATRVIIATQEPTISEKLLDLCTVSIIHRFTSPAWFACLQSHLGAAAKFATSTSDQVAMMGQIMNLEVGMSIVFAPSAFLCVSNAGQVGKLGSTVLNMRTRIRLGKDAGMSVLTSMATKDDNPTVEHAVDKTPSESDDSDADLVSPEDPLDRPEQGVVALRPKNLLAAQKIHRPAILHGHRAHNVVEANLPQHVFAGKQNRIAINRITPVLHDPPIQFPSNRPIVLDNAKAHLVLICFSCEKIVMVEYRERLISHFPGVDQQDVRSGIAHATCLQCLLQGASEAHRAVDKHDAVCAKEFRKAKVMLEHPLRHSLREGLRTKLDHRTIFLVGNRRPVYLCLTTVFPSLVGTESLYTVQVGVSQKKKPKIDLLVHEEGSFLKARS